MSHIIIIKNEDGVKLKIKRRIGARSCFCCLESIRHSQTQFGLIGMKDRRNTEDGNPNVNFLDSVLSIVNGN